MTGNYACSSLSRTSVPHRAPVAMAAPDSVEEEEDQLQEDQLNAIVSPHPKEDFNEACCA